MTIELINHLGRTIQLFMKDGTAFYYKPMIYNHGKKEYKGTDEENLSRYIQADDIEACIYFKNTDPHM